MNRETLLKVWWLWPLLILLLCLGAGLYLYMTSSDDEEFVDLPPEHWAYDTIMWAIEHEVITGYPDGTVQPNRGVNEAEFLAMIFRAYAELHPLPETVVLDPDAPAEDWAVKYYREAQALNWSILGRESRNQLISRLDMTRIISSALGYNLSADGAIQTILNYGLAEGLQAATVEGFGNRELTRAEALQVIKQMVERGTDTLLARPIAASEEPEINSEFYRRMLPVLKEAWNDGYNTRLTVWSREAGISFEHKDLIYFTYRGERSPYNLLILYESEEEAYRQFVQRLFEVFGLPVADGFAEVIHEVVTSRQAKQVSYGYWHFHITPGYNKSYTQVYFYKEMAQAQ
jgi:hypothetical protein